MPQPAGKSWTVLESIENDQHDRCVDLFQRTDGTWGFQEFRRDPEDSGAWTQMAYHAAAIHPSRQAARTAALRAVTWLTESNPAGSTE
jgi:hypothetical protein